MQAYRFLNNATVEVGELISVCSRLDSSFSKGRDVLVPIDETSITVAPSDARYRVETHGPDTWIGVSANNKSAGFSLFAGLAIDEHSDLVYGLSDIVHHCVPPTESTREITLKQRTKRRALPFEQIATYAWALVASNSHKQLTEAQCVTYMMDRGCDSYAVMAHILEMERAEILIRSRVNRKGRRIDTGQQGRLDSLFESSSWQSCKQVQLRQLDHYSKSSGKRKWRAARKTSLQLRYFPFQPDFPANMDNKSQPISRPLFAIEVLENPLYVPINEEPLHWRLLTSRPIQTIDEAWYIVNLYLKRWHIEQLFRLLKKQGLDIEATPFQSPKAIVKQSIIAMTSAAKVLQLDQAKKATQPLPIEIIFDSDEQLCLKEILPGLEGKTQKQQNPYDPQDLRWAAWIIARLGGWKGYASQRPPGPITFKRGLERFETISWTIKILKKKKETQSGFP